MAAWQPSSSAGHQAFEMPPVESVGGNHDWLDVHLASLSVVVEANKKSDKISKKPEHTELSLGDGENKERIVGGEKELAAISGNRADNVRPEATIVSMATESSDPVLVGNKGKHPDGEKREESVSKGADDVWNKKAWDILGNGGGVNSRGKFASPEKFWDQGLLNKWEKDNEMVISGNWRRGRETGEGGAPGRTDKEDPGGGVDVDTPENRPTMSANSTRKSAGGVGRAPLNPEYFRKHKVGSAWDFNFQRKRKHSSEQADGESNGDSVMFTHGSIKTGNKRNRNSKIFGGVSKGIMRTILRLREARLARRNIKRRWLPWTIYQGTGVKTIVHTFLDMLYYTCMSPFKLDKKPKEQMTRIGYIFSVIQPYIFCCFAILATWKAFADVKEVTLTFLEKRGPEDLFDIGSFLALGFVQTYAIYFLSFEQEQLTKMLRNWEFYEASTTDLGKQQNPRWRFWLVIAYGSGSMALTILRSILYRGFEKWSFPGMFQQYAADFSYGLDSWTLTDYNNSDALYHEYTKHANNSLVYTYGMGFLGFAMKTWSEVENDSIKNLLMFVSLVNDKHVRKFGIAARETIASILPFLSNAEKDQKCWRYYRLAKQDNAVTNDTFKTMLKFSHVNNVLLCAYLVTLFLDKKTKVADIIFISLELLKAAYAIAVARRTVLHNQATEEWIKKLPDGAQRFVVGNVSYARWLMLYELEKEPFGFGTGKWRIDDTLIEKVFGAVGSLVILLLTFHYGGIGLGSNDGKITA